MYSFMRRLRGAWLTRTPASTTFCEGCGEVCTPDCRRTALLEHRRQPARYSGIVRL